ncbi:MAG: hypothetical protein NVS3B3_09320 [Aquirhabdus sp.]
MSVTDAKPVATRLKDVAVSTKDMYMLDPATIVVEKDWNRRDFEDPKNIEHIETLAKSIAAVGLLNPIIVRFQDGRAVLADGECRLRATLIAIERGADIKAIQAVPEVRGVSDDKRLLAQATRNMGKQMSDLEWASVISGMMAFGWTEDRVAEAVGKDVAWVEAKLTLAEAPEAVKALVEANVVAAGTVVKAIKKDGVAKATETITNAAQEAQNAPGRSRIVADDGTPVAPRRITSKALEERGGAPPTRTYKREQIRDLVVCLQQIAQVDPTDFPSLEAAFERAQSLAVANLEALDIPISNEPINLAVGQRKTF